MYYVNYLKFVIMIFDKFRQSILYNARQKFPNEVKEEKDELDRKMHRNIILNSKQYKIAIFIWSGKSTTLCDW